VQTPPEPADPRLARSRRPGVPLDVAAWEVQEDLRHLARATSARQQLSSEGGAHLLYADVCREAGRTRGSLIRPWVHWSAAFLGLSALACGAMLTVATVLSGGERWLLALASASAGLAGVLVAMATSPEG
jgi:hypothetical protein